MQDTILIVDGDIGQSRILESALNKKFKYQSLTVSCGQDAIELVLSVDCKPNVMLMDMRVLQTEAIHVINIIKTRRPDFPIIIMIEYGDTNCAVEAINAGANDFLTKPVTN